MSINLMLICIYHFGSVLPWLSWRLIICYRTSPPLILILVILSRYHYSFWNIYNKIVWFCDTFIISKYIFRLFAMFCKLIIFWTSHSVYIVRGSYNWIPEAFWLFHGICYGISWYLSPPNPRKFSSSKIQTACQAVNKSSYKRLKVFYDW